MFISSALIASLSFFILSVSNGYSSFPKPLKSEEERKYLEDFQNGDINARNKLIEHNLRLVAHIAKKYYSNTSEQEDLISIGTLGLIKGVSTFKPDKGNKLSTYVSRCIENEILMHFRSVKKTASEISLSEPIDTDKNGNTLSLLDTIATEDIGLFQVENEDSYKLLEKNLNTKLTSREREIIILRYGLCGINALTQREISDKYNISRSYVSRIEKKALEKLSVDL